MLIVTRDDIPGREFEVLGLAMGSTVQSKHIGKDIGASFKGIVGGVLYRDARRRAKTILTAYGRKRRSHGSRCYSSAAFRFFDYSSGRCRNFSIRYRSQIQIAHLSASHSI